jgi:hypothetical protein
MNDLPANLPDHMATILSELRQSCTGLTEAQAINHLCDKLNMSLLGLRADALSNAQYQALLMSTAITHECKRLARLISDAS